MAKFLTTKGLSQKIEELIVNAKEKIILVSPFIQFSPSLFERLIYARRKGVQVDFIYGKNALLEIVWQRLVDLDCNVYFKDNLHAKCYLNEQFSIISSLNFYAYLEINNEEMGVILDSHSDKDAYYECLKQIEFLTQFSEVELISKDKQTLELDVKKTALNTVDEFSIAWNQCLRDSFPDVKFEQQDNFIRGKNFLCKGWEITTEFGIATLKMSFEKEVGRELKDRHFDDFRATLTNYRLYWNSPYDTLWLYHKKNYNTDTVEKDLNYCVNGVSLLLKCLKDVRII